MTSRHGQKRPKAKNHEHSDQQHDYLLGGKVVSSNPGSSDLSHIADWQAKLKLHTDRGSSLREQLLERDQHVARLQDTLRSEREKVSRLQWRCVQQEAELRRRERLSIRLKERLQPDRHRLREKGPSIEVLNLLPGGRGNGEQKSARNAAREETALRVMLERREAELREAMKLRHRVTTLLHALRVHMEQDFVDAQEAGNNMTRLLQAESQLGDHVTGGVARSWLKVQKRFGNILIKGHSAVGSDQENLILEQLETELKDCQHLVKLQQQLLQDSLFSPVPSDLTNSYFLEEWDRLQAQWAELNHHKHNFERERQSFTDAAIRLSREQREFEQEKASQLKQQFLSDSLFFKGAHSDRRESTALRCDHRQRRRFRVQTPSTPDLYCALNLPYTFSENACPPETMDRGQERIQLTPHVQQPDWSF